MTFPSEAARRAAAAAPAEGDAGPVFVYGALRSGTTLLRLMLDAHDRIGNPGEVDFLFDLVARDATHPTGWRYDLEALRRSRIFLGKALEIRPGHDGRDLLLDFCRQFRDREPGVVTLNVHRHAARIAELLPGARFVHLTRDPRDVARSAIGMGWAGTLYHGAALWQRTEEDWDRAAPRLAPDRVFEMRYEDLCTDPGTVLADLCAFLGVAYDPAMLGFHEGSSYGPVDARLAGQWRTRSTAREIALVEGRLARLMRARGYEPSGPGLVPGRTEALWLGLRNRLGIWAFGMRRFGGGLYWAEKAARRLGLSGLHRGLRTRMEEISLGHLK